jgi:hypothetical protein
MKKHLIIFTIMIFAAGLVLRLVDHPANFSPVFALALFSGVYLPKRWAISLPLALMFFTDTLIGFYDLRLMAVVYACFILMAGVGLLIKRRRNVLTVTAGALGSALLFFILTNLAVWALSGWYPHTWSGLLLNYALAVPFFKNTLLSSLTFTAVIFSAYEVLAWSLKFKRRAATLPNAIK